MSRLQEYIDSMDIMNRLTEQEFQNTVTLLNLYAKLVRQSECLVDEFSRECYESRRQSVMDFISLAVDYDHDRDCRHIAERLASTGHALCLLEIMEKALMVVREEPRRGCIYYRILNARYFDCCCRSNEQAFLNAGISSSTYYRHINNARRCYAAVLWHVVVPDLAIAVRAPAGAEAAD